MGVWYRADKTTLAIESAIYADQGNAFRAHLKHTIAALTDAYKVNELPVRPHMGASGIGDECARKIWNSFRWLTPVFFSGRMLRLFNRGHLEEARVYASLLTIGVKLYTVDGNGKQFGFSRYGGHFAGSGDGVAIGIPDLPPDTPVLVEVKTSKTDDFLKMQEFGVKSENYKHYVQMNQYMRELKLKYTLYVMVCKETDEYHMEIVPYDPECAERFSERARAIIFMKTPPNGIGKSPGWYKCKLCDHNQTCHGLAPIQKNCRTCQFGDPVETGYQEWRCSKFNVALDMQTQYNGCQQYVKNSHI